MAMLVLMRLVPGLRAMHYFTGSYKALRGDHFGFGFERHLCYNELKHTVSQKKSSNLTTTQHDDIRKPHLGGSGEIIAFRYSEINLLKMVTKNEMKTRKHSKACTYKPFMPMLMLMLCYAYSSLVCVPCAGSLELTNPYAYAMLCYAFSSLVCAPCTGSLVCTNPYAYAYAYAMLCYASSSLVCVPCAVALVFTNP